MPLNRFTYATAAILVLVALLAFIQFRRGSRPERFDAATFSPQTVSLATGVHLLGRGEPSASYIVETAGGLLLVDTGLDANAGLIVEQVSDLGLPLEELKVILLTHVHGDHSLGALRLKQLTGASICAGAGDSQQLRDGGPRQAFFSTFYMPHVSVHATPIDRLLNDGDVIQVGQTKIDCIATPGHTHGSFCYLMERNGQRILFTGDTITSLTNDLGIYAASLAPRYRGDAESYLASLNRLLDMPAPDLVLPGHPRMDRVGQSPRLTNSDWQGLLERGISETRSILQRFNADGKDFLDGNPKEILPGLYYLGDLHRRAVYAAVHADRVFVFDAPGPGLVTFLRRRCESLGIELAGDLTILLTSTDPSATAGLNDLAQSYSCTVITRQEGVEELRQQFAPSTAIFNTREFAKQTTLPIDVHFIEGVARNSVAYTIKWEDRVIALTGSAPLILNNLTLQLLAVWVQRNQIRELLDGLQRLKAIAPDIWLPSFPVHGQNANLYASEWADAIMSNQRLISGGPPDRR